MKTTYIDSDKVALVESTTVKGTYSRKLPSLLGYILAVKMWLQTVSG